VVTDDYYGKTRHPLPEEREGMTNRAKELSKQLGISTFEEILERQLRDPDESGHRVRMNPDTEYG
jgi:hypothetical protein